MKGGAFRPVHILAGVRANLSGNVARTAASTRGLACSVQASQGTVTGNGTVVCQVEGPDGHVTTIGSFRLTGGYGYWGSPDPATNGPLTGARLVTTTGAILAIATFPT